MIVEIKIPSPGESISEVEIGRWLVEEGAVVAKDQEIAEIESDKATLSLIASVSGAVKILVGEGERVAVGAVACQIDTEKAGAVVVEAPNEAKPVAEPAKTIEKAVETKVEEVAHPVVKLTPAAKAVMDEEGMSLEDVLNGLKRLTRQDIEKAADSFKKVAPAFEKEVSREEDRIAMSPLRRKLSQRLVAVKNETAMLTTFNEVDMRPVMELRKAYQQKFLEKHGLKLGFMSFFTKAVSIALAKHPSVNSMIDGEEIITPRYHDIGIAVSTPKGLMVPIIRNAEVKSIATIEREIKEMADKARDRKLTVQEMTGGTFTITNGGVFGSLMSTPIINPPQSAILGMHSIKDRPVAVDGKVEIRPMMYIALSYDHRIIDGKDSVGFLVKIKELIENPMRLLFDGRSGEELLLEL